MPIPPDPHNYCRVANTVAITCFLCSTLLLVSMTFDRFYSIIRPHKAASFNTVKRAKVTIACIVVISILYNIPHLFLTSHDGWQCLPYGTAMSFTFGVFYYWLSFVVHYALPFVLLLTMNSVIIHKIRHRSLSTSVRNAKGAKNAESQLFAILLLVTFAFLILTTPGYFLFLFIMFVNFFETAQLFAGYYLLYSVAQKLHVTNHGINFFLYVISGQKFRTDLVNLFRFKQAASEISKLNRTELSVVKCLNFHQEIPAVQTYVHSRPDL